MSDDEESFGVSMMMLDGGKDGCGCRQIKFVDKLDNYFFGWVCSPSLFESEECFFGASRCAT